MPQATYSVTIERPIDAVFAFVANGEQAKRWRPSVRDIVRAGGTADGGVGTRYLQGVKGPLRRRISADFDITVYEPNKLLEFQTVSGPARPHGRYEFAQVEGGTRVTFSLDTELTGLRKLLMERSVQRSMDSEVLALDNLKGVLES
jgi:uncharacterized protein YndB with AHSA1/START domain